MKSAAIIKSLAAVILLSELGLSTAVASEHDKKEQAELISPVKISQQEATQIDLQSVSGCSLKEAEEIEKEKGKLIYCFDITHPNAKGISGVNIDALTGYVVNIEKEHRKG